MDYFRRFTFLFAAPAFDADDLEGIRFNQFTEARQSPQRSYGHGCPCRAALGALPVQRLKACVNALTSR
jgi:hypothetical protein